MHFLPDVYVPCEVCNGKRYNRETLEIKYKGKSISDVLNMTIEESYKFFENIPKIKNKLETIVNVGLGYIKLGQSATTLSGGEAQRVKIASELYKKSTGKTLYILDEPTTGLHIDDISRLIKIIEKLVENGNSVIVIEHNLEKEFDCTAKFRYRQKDTTVKVKILDNNTVEVIYKEKVRAVTPGQSVVFYKDDICLGGAIIDYVFRNNKKLKL